MSRNRYAAEYAEANTSGAVASADAHGLITLMLRGASERVAMAQSCVTRGDLGAKAREIGAAISIVEGLRMALDRSRGGELAERLDSLYDWMTRRLVLANATNSSALLTEVEGLLGQIRAGWEGIPEALRKSAQVAA